MQFLGFLIYFVVLSGAWAWDFELGACGWKLGFEDLMSMPNPRSGGILQGKLAKLVRLGMLGKLCMAKLG